MEAETTDALEAGMWGVEHAEHTIRCNLPPGGISLMIAVHQERGGELEPSRGRSARQQQPYSGLTWLKMANRSAGVPSRELSGSDGFIYALTPT